MTKKPKKCYVKWWKQFALVVYRFVVEIVDKCVWCFFLRIRDPKHSQWLKSNATIMRLLFLFRLRKLLVEQQTTNEWTPKKQKNKFNVRVFVYKVSGRMFYISTFRFDTFLLPHAVVFATRQTQLNVFGEQLWRSSMFLCYYTHCIQIRL